MAWHSDSCVFGGKLMLVCLWLTRREATRRSKWIQRARMQSCGMSAVVEDPRSLILGHTDMVYSSLQDGDALEWSFTHCARWQASRIAERMARGVHAYGYLCAGSGDRLMD